MTVLAWMAAAAALAALLAVAGAAGEPLGERVLGRRRTVWALVIVLSSALPWALALAGPAGGAAPRLGWAPAPAGGASAGWPPNAVVVAAWASLSVVVAAVLAIHHAALRRAAVSCRPRSLFGRTVWVGGALGPAVVGFAAPKIVLPSWILGLAAEEQRLIIAHEARHVAARDQWFLLLGLAAVTLMPWNPALWYALARLRLALELDCDRHVARQTIVERYCRLLLEAHARTTVRVNVGLAARRSTLGRRVDALLRPPRIRAVTLVPRVLLLASSITVMGAIRFPSLPGRGPDAAARPAAERPAATVAPARAAFVPGDPTADTAAGRYGLLTRATGARAPARPSRAAFAPGGTIRPLGRPVQPSRLTAADTARPRR